MYKNWTVIVLYENWLLLYCMKIGCYCILWKWVVIALYENWLLLYCMKIEFLLYCILYFSRSRPYIQSDDGYVYAAETVAVAVFTCMIKAVHRLW